MTEVKQLRAGLWQISLPFQDEEEIIGSYLLAGNNELLLIDPGRSSTPEALLDGLREAGFDQQDITHILVTHVHLDHAGAVGSLARRVSKAQVYVHKLGASHLQDTSKLVASAQRIYGERMQQLWGDIQDVPAEQLHALEGNEIPRCWAPTGDTLYSWPCNSSHHWL